MKKFGDMANAIKSYSTEKQKFYATKYRAYIEYLKKVIMLSFEDNIESIISYIKEIDDKTLLIDWCVGGIHYDGFYITVAEDSKSIIIKSFTAHDEYYDPNLNVAAGVTDEEIVNFFEREYKRFLSLFAPNTDFEDFGENRSIDLSKSLVNKIVDQFNYSLFNKFAASFHDLDIKEFREFEQTDYALKFDEKRLIELEKKACVSYDLYVETVEDLTNKFDDSVKDLIN